MLLVNCFKVRYQILDLNKNNKILMKITYIQKDLLIRIKEDKQPAFRVSSSEK